MILNCRSFPSSEREICCKYLTNPEVYNDDNAPYPHTIEETHEQEYLKNCSITIFSVVLDDVTGPSISAHFMPNILFMGWNLSLFINVAGVM